MKGKKFQELNLSDDFMFAAVMTDEEILKPVIEKVLDMRISEIQIVQPQRVIDIEPESRGIRIDIFADDGDRNRYSVEMQKLNEYNLERRSRYYHSMMDLDLIEKGENFQNLRDGIVIFICLFDPYHLGLHRYTFEKVCRENKDLKMNDGNRTVFLSTKGMMKDVDDEMLEFLRYVENSSDETAASSESELVRKIHQKVKSVKSNKAREAEFMKMQERDVRNRKAGELLVFREVTEKKLAKNMTPAEIAEFLEQDVRLIEYIADLLKSEPELDEEDFLWKVYQKSLDLENLTDRH